MEREAARDPPAGGGLWQTAVQRDRVDLAGCRAASVSRRSGRWRPRRRRSPASCGRSPTDVRGMARLAGQGVGGAHDRRRRSAPSGSGWPPRLAEAEQRARAAHEEFASVESQIAGLDEGEVDLDAEFEIGVAGAGAGAGAGGGAA